MKITITQQQLETCDLTYVHGGSGFVMVEDLDKEYCRVSMCGKRGIGPIVYLAAKDRLNASPGRVFDEQRQLWVSTGRDMPIESSAMPKLTEIRTGIRSGKLKVEKNRVVKA